MLPLAGVPILIVDDESELRDILAEEFDALGAEVRTASGGDEAYQIFEAFRPLILLTDLRMSKGDGTSLLSRIRQFHPKSQTYVFLISGYAEPHQADGQTSEFEEFVSKPFSLKALRARVVTVSQEIQSRRGGT